ncbi:Predicted G-protein coupled receptor (GPCR), partial [Gryllus bimaculatus]
MLIVGSLLLTAVRIHPVKAKIVDGELNTYENWAFIERFCFLSAEGKFEYLIEYEKTYSVQKLLLYYDTFDQWASAYFPGLSCEQRESLAKMSRKQIVNLTDQVPSSGCETIRTTGQRYLVRCHESRRFNSARQRWWFIAVSNCNSSKGLSLKYRFWMTNGPTGDFWHEHFSADEFYILPILITFCILYIIIILAAIACAVELKHRHLLHSTYKLFMISALLQECGIILQCSAYIKYGLDGIGSIQALIM